MLILHSLTLIFSLILTYIKCGDIDSDNFSIELEKKYNGTLLTDNSLYFYKLEIPKEIQPNSYNLVFRVKEPELADLGKIDFSDPDIYVSKIIKFPKNIFESQYYSERYGEDFLSIPSKEVNGGDIFYFAIYCQYKCQYEFSVFLESEYKIIEDQIYTFFLTEGKSISLKFEQNRDDFKEIEFISYSSKMSAYKMYVSKESNPSSTNTFTIIPSWIGGYYASTIKNNYNFCKNCTYNILLEAEKNTAEINFMVKYENSVNKIKSHQQIFSTVKPFGSHCYSIDVTESNKNETLIVQTMLFSGSSTLLINPWTNPMVTGERFKIVEDIASEGIKLITAKDRKNKDTETGTVYICLKSYDYTSYLLKIFFENQFEKYQKFNFLYTGVNLNGYLPKNTVTKYRAVEFSKNSDVTFDIQINSGNLSVYGYVCEEMRNCKFTFENFEPNKIGLLESTKTPNGYKITIPDSINTCHRKLEKEESFKNEVASLPCAVLAILKCEGSEPCSYTIISSHTNSITKLKERKPHYQIISYNQTDTYKINIDDEKISNITIILNSITGDADLFVTGSNNNFDSRSVNEGYIPDVIGITKSEFFPSIKGEYLINVKGATFASYSIYYYTHKIDEMQPNLVNNKTLAITLETGRIIKGYTIEESNKPNLKIYSYNPKILPDSDKLDIRITLTPEHSEYHMYVLFDIDNIQLDDSKNYYITNYLWKSNLNHEIVIKKTDQNYFKDKDYYIIIVPKINYFLNNFSNSTNFKNTNNTIHAFFYLGVTTEDKPFVIQEGIPNSITLDSDYNSQNYWYYHYNISNPVFVSLNVFYGRVDIFIDLWWSEDISSSKTVIKALDTDSNYIRISPEKLKYLLSAGFNNQIKDFNNTIIPLYILIKKSSSLDSQYLLAVKSHESKPEKLQPEIVRSEFLLSGEYRNYFLHLRNNSTGMINIVFNSGYGDLYMNIYSYNDYENADNYPKATNYMHKAHNYYRGKTISISNNLLSKCLGSCKILLSIHGNNLGYLDDKIEYGLSFYKEVLKINQNQPFHNRINEGEIQFLRVFFGEDTKNIYISLTNMDGDADIYVNFGSDLPTFDKYTWSSTTIKSEFIEFNKNDNFFIVNNLQNLSGEYTIMITGFTKTSYSLYITSHPKKILPLNDNSPASCYTKENSEYCYFRYDDVYDYDTVINDSYNSNNSPIKKDVDLVINTNFFYGSGVIFGKLYDDTDYDILQDFPDENNYDYSNILSNYRNLLYLEINKNNLKYNLNSTLLISVKCENKCFFDLTATRQYESTITYLDTRKENIYYLKKSNSSLLFIYYNNKQGDIDYNLRAFAGSANVRLLTNDTAVEGIKENIYLDEFNSTSDLKSENDIHKKITFKQLGIYQNLYFKILPQSNFAFSLRITYQHDWQEIKMGKVQTYSVNRIKKKFHGYLTLHDEYDSIILSITTNNKNLTAYCYVKYIYSDKNDFLNKTSTNISRESYMIPNELDFDFKGDNLNLLSLIAIKLPKLKKNSKNESVKVLFSVFLFDHSESKEISDMKLNIRASPKIDNITVSIIPQNSIELVHVEGYDSDSSIHIYDLKRNNNEDDVLFLEVSSCMGAVDVYLSSKIINNKIDAQKNSFYPNSLEQSNGRTVYIYKNLNRDNYYLLINGKNVFSKDCDFELKINKQNCENKVSQVLLNYYTKKSSDLVNIPNIVNQGMNLIFDVLGYDSIRLKWKPLLEVYENLSFHQHEDVEEYKLAPVKYNVFVSMAINDYMYMDSVCYLNTFENMNSKDLKIAISESKSEARISNMKAGRKYFLNVLATNVYTKDVYAYKAIEIILQESLISPYLIGGISLIIILLVFSVFYFFRKYKKTKRILNYEINDVRNCTSIPKDGSELRELESHSNSYSQRNYHNLNEEGAPKV